MFSLDVLAVFQMDKSPELWIRPEDDMSSASSVTSVRSSLRYIFGSVQMCGTCTSVPGSTVYLYVVYEIRIGHNFLQIDILAKIGILLMCRYGIDEIFEIPSLELMQGGIG